MLFFYIRHADPIYNPDSLTPLGERQAEALAKRLAVHGLDRIYASTSNRALLTAKPTGELLKKEVVQLDFCNERYAWESFSVPREGGNRWLYTDEETKKLFRKPEITGLGAKWYEHPLMTDYKKSVDKYYDQLDSFFAELGYEHIRGTGNYKVIKKNDERVALFAHEGFGLIFLSTVLDIPYPVVAMRMAIGHSGMTVINFEEGEDGYCVPRMLMLSSDSHVYREGLPTKYFNEIPI